jgi:hypothetical protein
MWSVTATQERYSLFDLFLEDLDTPSLIDVYERMIFAATK